MTRSTEPVTAAFTQRSIRFRWPVLSGCNRLPISLREPVANAPLWLYLFLSRRQATLVSSSTPSSINWDSVLIFQCTDTDNGSPAPRPHGPTGPTAPRLRGSTAAPIQNINIFVVLFLFCFVCLSSFLSSTNKSVLVLSVLNNCHYWVLIVALTGQWENPHALPLFLHIDHWNWK